MCLLFLIVFGSFKTTIWRTIRFSALYKKLIVFSCFFPFEFCSELRPPYKTKFPFPYTLWPSLSVTHLVKLCFFFFPTGCNVLSNLVAAFFCEQMNKQKNFFLCKSSGTNQVMHILKIFKPYANTSGGKKMFLYFCHSECIQLCCFMHLVLVSFSASL